MIRTWFPLSNYSNQSIIFFILIPNTNFCNHLSIDASFRIIRVMIQASDVTKPKIFSSVVMPSKSVGVIHFDYNEKNVRFEGHLYQLVI